MVPLPAAEPGDAWNGVTLAIDVADREAVGGRSPPRESGGLVVYLAGSHRVCSLSHPRATLSLSDRSAGVATADRGHRTGGSEEETRTR